jgi:hypothetical protein
VQEMLKMAYLAGAKLAALESEELVNAMPWLVPGLGPLAGPVLAGAQAPEGRGWDRALATTLGGGAGAFSGAIAGLALRPRSPVSGMLGIGLGGALGSVLATRASKDGDSWFHHLRS